MDDDSKELVEITSKAFAEGTTRAFIETIFGPAVEVGEFLRDQVRYRRVMVQIKMLKRASGFLEDQGIPANQVSLKLLVPLLDLSSLENDDAMVDRWAALLANAAAGDEGATVLPSFPRILAELTPADAAILDRLYAGAGPNPVASMFHVHPDDEGLGKDDEMFVARCYNLERLGLLHVGWENKLISETDPLTYRHTIARLEGSQLGASFIAACSPPAPGAN